MLKFIEFGADVPSALRGRHDTELAGRRLVEYTAYTTIGDEHAESQLQFYITHVLRRSATGEVRDVDTAWDDNKGGAPCAVLYFRAHDDTGARLAP